MGPCLRCVKPCNTHDQRLLALAGRSWRTVGFPAAVRPVLGAGSSRSVGAGTWEGRHPKVHVLVESSAAAVRTKVLRGWAGDVRRSVHHLDPHVGELTTSTSFPRT